MAESLYNLFEKAVSFSKQKRIKRLFRYPFFTISRSIVLRLRAFHVFKFLISAKTFWGEKMFFPVQCDRLTIFQWGFITGEPEIELTRTMIRHLKEGDVFVDIGAHHGFYSLLASCLVGDSGQVYSFEPTPRTFQVLAKNTFQKKNISIYQKAIWNRGGGALLSLLISEKNFLNVIPG